MKTLSIPGCLLLLASLAPAGAQTANAQGWVVDRHNRPTGLVVSDHQVSGDIRHTVASVVVETAFRNPTRATVEGVFVFPLPPGASVSTFTLEIDGKPVNGEVLESKHARGIYEEIVRNSLDPALLEWADNSMFKASIFPIAPLEERRIALRYDVVLDRAGDGAVRFVHPMYGDASIARTARVQRPPHFPSSRPGGSPSMPPDAERKRSTIELTIRSDGGIRNIYSPTHELDVDNERGRARVEATRMVSQSARNFILYYSLSDERLAATFLPHRPYTSKPGYFMLMLDPSAGRRADAAHPRDVLFVLDTSGSMAGEKIEQAKQAVSHALRRLGDRDRFALVTFSSNVHAFNDRLSASSDVGDALHFVERLEASGGTNINEALLTALGMLDGSRRGTVIFLTDGLPSTGETSVDRILQNVERANDHETKIFPFGVGYDVNTRLLDGIARSASSFADYIAPEENIEERVSGFYDRVRHPVMTDITFRVDGVRIDKLAPREPGDIFFGDALILTGQYEDSGRATVTVSGWLDGERTVEEIPVTFPRVERESGFVARLWATRRVGGLLETIRLEGESDELKSEIIDLATEYGIVTPYTSYLVVEDEMELADLPAVVGQRTPIGRDAVGAPALDRRNSGFSASGAAASPAAAAREEAAAMQQSSGQGAVELSRKLAQYQQADQAYDADGLVSTVVAGQTLLQSSSGAWRTSQETKDLQQWNVQFGSDAYFAFARAYPDAAGFLKLGGEVEFVFRGWLIQVGEAGDDKATEAALQKKFG